MFNLSPKLVRIYGFKSMTVEIGWNASVFYCAFIMKVTGRVSALSREGRCRFETFCSTGREGRRSVSLSATQTASCSSVFTDLPEKISTSEFLLMWSSILCHSCIDQWTWVGLWFSERCWCCWWLTLASVRPRLWRSTSRLVTHSSSALSRSV